MRLVLLTGEGAEHRYLTDTLTAAFPDELRAIVVARPAASPAFARFRRYVRKYTVRQLASRVWARLYALRTGAAARRGAVYSRLLYPQGDPGRILREDLVRFVPGHNSPECLALLSGIEPDVIAVYGTGIIREPVMKMAGNGVINMHTGISPRYRGADTIFWALHNEEPEWVGATIHLLDAGIDSGPIIRTVHPEIRPDDDEDSLFCKSVVLGSRQYVEAVRVVAAGAPIGAPQSLEAGREYRFVDRTVAAEKRVRRLLREGLLSRPAGQHG